MKPEEIASLWDAHYPDCAPVPELLRERYGSRWARFRTLPGGKRVPESDLERATVLTRYNAILSSYLGAGDEFVLITAGYSRSARAERDHSGLEAFDPGARWWRSLRMHELSRAYPDPSYAHLYASQWRWRDGALDSILALVAVEQVAQAMVLELSGFRIFYPFPGGCDAFLRKGSERDELKAQFYFWLPEPQS